MFIFPFRHFPFQVPSTHNLDWQLPAKNGISILIQQFTFDNKSHLKVVKDVININRSTSYNKLTFFSHHKQCFRNFFFSKLCANTELCENCAISFAKNFLCCNLLSWQSSLVLLLIQNYPFSNWNDGKESCFPSQ